MKAKTILFLFISITLLSSCLEKNKEKVLNIYSRQKIQNIEPAKASTVYEERVSRQIFETLYEYSYLGDQDELIPLIAEALPKISKDGLTYTIKIKPEIKFIDDTCFKSTKGKGRSVKAQDVIYSLKYFAASPPFKRSFFMYYIDGLIDFRKNAKLAYKKGIDRVTFIKRNEVSGLKLEDENTVSIKLVQPCPYFIETMIQPGASIIPIEALEYYGDKFNEHPVGTGPFMLDSLNKNGKTILVKNKNYVHTKYPTRGSEEEVNRGFLKDANLQLPLIDKIVIKNISTDREREIAFNKGEIDLYSPEQESFYDYFPNDNHLSKASLDLGVGVEQVNNSKFSGLLLNMKDPLIAKNKFLRKAIIHSFDNAKNISVFFYEKPITAYWIIPPNVFGYDSNYRNPCAYNIEEAKKDLAKAGYPNGKGLEELVLLLERTPLMGRVGKFFAESASKVGINVKLEFVDQLEDVKKIISEGNRKIHIFAVSEYSLFSTPEALLRMFYKGKLKYKTNYSSYYNLEYENLYEKVALINKGPEKIKLLNRMRDIVIEDHVVIPLSFSLLYRLHYDYVKNYKPHVMMFDRYKYVNIDTEQKKQIIKKLPK